MRHFKRRRRQSSIVNKENYIPITESTYREKGEENIATFS